MNTLADESAETGKNEGEDDCRPTPGMIAAGVDAFDLSFGSYDFTPWLIERAVESIYCAMIAAENQRDR